MTNTAVEPRLTSAQLADNKIILDWTDGTHSGFHFIWLRDNCRCASCGDPSIGRRTLQLTNIDLDVSATSVAIDTPSDNDCSLRIRWSDAHQSVFSEARLQTHRYDTATRGQRCFKPALWTQAFRDNPPVLDYQRVNDNDRDFVEMLSTVRDHGLCFLKGAQAMDGLLEPFVAKIGHIQESNFGRVQDLILDHSKLSIANDVHALKPHTDEPYRASAPGILIFHCIETDVSGSGSSLFMDGFEIAETLREEDPEGFTALTKHRQAFRRHFKGDVDAIAEFPVISVDEFGNVCGVRINDRVAAPLCIDENDVEVYYRGLKRLLQLAEDPKRMMTRTLQPGDIAIFDNHRLLHGRTTISMSGKRWLQWVQIKRGDFHSTLRIASDRLGLPRGINPLLRGAYG